ncbi:MAG: leucine-rich repeat domain-containing protein [Candidatus Methanoplasma sp.]|jgi:hypothetical protein|nr:leucine-rich repeat domain-containing protein [Candidatus Methanoplasma sp.]
MKASKVLIVVALLTIVTASAFVLSDNNVSSAVDIMFLGPDGRFTFVYDDSGSLDLDSNPSTKEVTLTAYNFNEDYVTIPNTVEDSGTTYLVTAIGEKAFYHKDFMKTLVMGDNVKEIGKAAFWECTGLQSLNLKNVKSVGEQAFIHCTSVTSITAGSLVTIGNYAFAIINVPSSPYTGDIPVTGNLYLPLVETIGYGAFGTVNGTSLARDFISVILPIATNIGDYAFSESKITGYISAPRAEAIGANAFNLAAAADSDTSLGYELSLSSAKTIGNNAFTGRALTSVALPGNQPYTIGNNAFAYTKLSYANLGMVQSIGTSAFDHISSLEYFTTATENLDYASSLSNNLGELGEPGALYKSDGVGHPTQLYKLPPMIKSRLQDSDNKFTVFDGVTQMAVSAFEKCPSISVDLNEITQIPVSAFSGSDVLKVSAKMSRR